MVNIENSFESPKQSDGLKVQKNLKKSGNPENPESVVSPLRVTVKTIERHSI